MSRFRAALSVGTSAGDLSDTWTAYALSTNERGDQLIAKLEAEFVGSLAGKRVLDIGSGYGGVCIAAARHGARVVGLEPEERTLSLARENLRDHPGVEVTFLAEDALSPEAVGRLGHFDVIVCDNVIEHVDDARRLVNNVSMLLDGAGIAYVTAPNAFSVGQVLSECHYHLFGISLLDRFDAQSRFSELGMPDVYRVGDYFDHDQYCGMFEAAGLTHQQLVPLSDDGKLLSELRDRADQVEQKQRAVRSESGPAAKKLDLAVGLWLRRFRDRYADAAGASEPRRTRLLRAMSRDYELELWYFVARGPSQ